MGLWTGFAAVSSTFLGASKVPSVNTVRESRGLALTPVRAGRELNIRVWHHGCIKGAGREGKGREVSGGWRDRGVSWDALPSLARAEDGLWSWTDSSHLAHCGQRWFGVRYWQGQGLVEGAGRRAPGTAGSGSCPRGAPRRLE